MKNGIKLVCFELDKTLIDQNSWYKVNLALGMTKEEDQDLYGRYFNHEFTYEEWVVKIMELYDKRGRATKENVEAALSDYELVPGAREIVQYLKAKRYKVALVSGSIDILVNKVANDLNIELAEAINDFEFDADGKLARIVTRGKDTIAKLDILVDMCDKEGVDITECACVGDGANDAEMFRKTGHGITFADSNIKQDAWKIIDKLEEIKTIL